MELGVKITGELKVNGETVGFSSPTTTLRADIVNEVGSNSTYISKIDKIVLVDSNGNERDYTTSLSYTDHTPLASPSVDISGTINITASYNVAYIRLYAGTKKYFEYGWSRSVYSGDQVLVQVTITVSASGSLSGTTTNSGFSPSYNFEIARALIGSNRQQIGFYGMQLLDSNNNILVIGFFSNTIDTTNMKVTGDTGTVAPSKTGSAVLLLFLNSNGVSMVSFSLASSISLTPNTLVQVTFTFTC